MFVPYAPNGRANRPARDQAHKILREPEFEKERLKTRQLANKVQFVSQFMVPALLGPNVPILEVRHTPGIWCNQAVMSGTPSPEKPIKSGD